ncbi:MotA/TolQ/ExbB proton channel family protein [bacterium]|nr:MotA/TolQ/ExbB proton channel family protein [bacterium]
MRPKNLFYLIFVLFPFLSVQADEYKIHIRNVHRDLKTDWKRLPKSADCTIEWELYSGAEGSWKIVPFNELESFNLVCFNGENPGDVVGEQNSDGNFATITNLTAFIKYGFVVRGMQANTVIAVSDTAWLTIGRINAVDDAGFIWHHWIPLNGRIPMQFIGHENYFDSATKAGKMAFHLIWNFLLIGIVIWVFYCFRHLRFNVIFPMKDRDDEDFFEKLETQDPDKYAKIIRRTQKGKKWFHIFDAFYDKHISTRFTVQILDKWHDVIEKSNIEIDLFIRSGNEAITSEKISIANAAFWKDKGSREIEIIKQSTKDIRIRVKKLFGLGKTEKHTLYEYSTVKIVHAGLEKHELGGYHWKTCSANIDRAIENRAASELDRLRQNTRMDWLWNLGTLAPLIGLFGTATGISNAFKNLVEMKSDSSQADLVKQLAGGINEALWTTILGLAVSFFMMLLYFYYQNKLNWIYSKWEELYIHVSEKL